MTVDIAEVNSAQIKTLDRQLQRVYVSAFSLPPYREGETDVVRFRESLARHSQRGGFRCVVAQDSERGVVGFGYGFRSAPGQWWRDTVEEALGEENARVWLSDAFEFVELAVAPLAQGRGIGGRIHDELLGGISYRTAVLSTYHEDTPARKLYLNRGWITLLWDFDFPGAPRPVSVMGLDLNGLRSKQGRENG